MVLMSTEPGDIFERRCYNRLHDLSRATEEAVRFIENGAVALGSMR